jgi:hypothetical protein
VARLVALVVLLAACDTRVGADPARVFLLDRLRVDRAQAERAAAHLDNPSFPCASMIATAASFAKEWEKLAPATRAELEGARRLCFDAALVYGLTRAARLEHARRARTELVEECFDLERALDILVLVHPIDPIVSGLTSRRKLLCP